MAHRYTSSMHQHDDEFAPDPKKITVRGGAIFNPWVNIPACVILTIGLGWLTLWMLSMYIEVTESAPYPDQPLDAAGVMIGAIFLGLATIVLFACTIFVIVWWARRIRREREQQSDGR